MQSFLAAMSENEKKQWQQAGQLLNFKRGDRIYQTGDQPKGLFFVNSGLISLMIEGARSGREHLVRFFTPGQFFGHRSLFSEERHHGTTVVLEPTQVTLVPKETAIGIVRHNPKLLEIISRVLAGELRRCELTHIDILENDVDARVAQSVIYLQHIKPDHNWTRQEIANFCASTVSTVIKTLAFFENEGWIRQEGRRIEVLKREQLLQLGHFDPSL